MASGLSTQDHLAVLLYLIRSASTVINDMQAAARDCPFGAMEWNGKNDSRMTCANHDEKYNKFQSVAWEIHVDLMWQVCVQEKCATVYIMEKTTLNFDFSELSNL